MDTDDVIKFFKSREETTVLFDKEYKNELIELIKDIIKTNQNYILLFSKNPEKIIVKNKEEFYLLFQSIDYLITATNLVRQRAIFESFNIIRLSLETSATAFHINRNPDQLKNYKSGKYKSTKAIGFANEFIPRFGEIWGALSQLAVHTNSMHGIFSYVKDDYLIERGNITYGVKEKNELQDKSSLLLLRITANIIYRFFELIFYKKAKFKGVEGMYQDETKLFMFGKKTDKIIEELINIFIKNCDQTTVM